MEDIKCINCGAIEAVTLYQNEDRTSFVPFCEECVARLREYDEEEEGLLKE